MTILRMRSLLLVPGSDEARVEAALSSDADAVAIDLDVGAGRASARRLCARFCDASLADAARIIVRISPLDSGETDRDLDAVVVKRIFAVLLPQALGAASVQQLSAKLAVREAASGLPDGATNILAAVDNAAAVLAAASFAGSSARLAGLVFDAAALKTEMGIKTADAAGPLNHARNQTRLAAAAARIAAIDGPADDDDAAPAEADAARRFGFAGKCARTAAQAITINAAFSAARYANELAITRPRPAAP